MHPDVQHTFTWRADSAVIPRFSCLGEPTLFPLFLSEQKAEAPHISAFASAPIETRGNSNGDLRGVRALSAPEKNITPAEATRNDAVEASREVRIHSAPQLLGGRKAAAKKTALEFSGKSSSEDASTPSLGVGAKAAAMESEGGTGGSIEGSRSPAPPPQVRGFWYTRRGVGGRQQGRTMRTCRDSVCGSRVIVHRKIAASACMPIIPWGTT